MLVDYAILPIPLPLLPSVWKTDMSQERFTTFNYNFMLFARSELSGKGIRKNEQVILVHEDTTGTGHCLFQYLGLSVSVFISSMEKLAQKSDPWRNELNKKWMCTMAFQEDLFKIGHTEFTPPKAWLFREYSRYHLGRLIDVGWYETKTLMKNRINKWNRWSRHI